MWDIVYDVQADLDALNLINGKKKGGGRGSSFTFISLDFKKSF
jgi:hypothetical protein